MAWSLCSDVSAITYMMMYQFMDKLDLLQPQIEYIENTLIVSIVVALLTYIILSWLLHE